MMRSSKPSPLMSPAEDTDTPALIVRILAMDDEAAVAGRDRGEIDLGREAARPCRTPRSCRPQHCARVAGAIAERMSR